MYRIEDELIRLTQENNLRHIPVSGSGVKADFSSNDYLGIGADKSLQHDFLLSVSD